MLSPTKPAAISEERSGPAREAFFFNEGGSMAVKSYRDKNGEIRFRVYVNLRSRMNYSVRVQKKAKGFKTEAEAKREELKIIRELEREIAGKEAKGETWGNLVLEWEKYLISGQGLESRMPQESTREGYISALGKYTRSWWNRTAAGITRFDVRETISELQAHGCSVSYQNKIKVIINRVFMFGIESGLVREIDRSPTFGIRLGRQEEKKPEILTIGEIRKLLEEAKALNYPWYPIWAVAILTGMRNGELYALKWTDVDWENKMISVTKSYNTRTRSVKSTKSGDWRTIPISSELLSLLKELKLKAGARTWVLPHPPGWEKGMQAKELRKFCSGVGLPSVKFHALRACFATQLIRNGVPPIQIQKICGWKDLETMQRYIRLAGIETEGVTEVLRVLPDEQVMAKVVNLFGDGTTQPEPVL
ncbi:MAG: tyrosine-type recombinase/integrase [Bacteriovoracia bacterium]